MRSLKNERVSALLEFMSKIEGQESFVVLDIGQTYFE